MVVRDNQGKVVGQIEHFRDANGNTVDTNTMYSNERPVVQLITVRDNQGHTESKTILNGKLLPWWHEATRQERELRHRATMRALAADVVLKVDWTSGQATSDFTINSDLLRQMRTGVARWASRTSPWSPLAWPLPDSGSPCSACEPAITSKARESAYTRQSQEFRWKQRRKGTRNGRTRHRLSALRGQMNPCSENASGCSVAPAISSHCQTSCQVAPIGCFSAAWATRVRQRPQDGHQLSLSANLHAEHGESALLAEERDSFHESGDPFGRGRRLWGGVVHPGWKCKRWIWVQEF